jgi:hypothetical protein
MKYEEAKRRILEENPDMSKWFFVINLKWCFALNGIARVKSTPTVKTNRPQETAHTMRSPFYIIHKRHRIL